MKVSGGNTGKNSDGLGTAGLFNVFMLADHCQYDSGAGGCVAVGGSVQYHNYDIGCSMTKKGCDAGLGSSGLIVAGDVDIRGGSNFGGSIVVYPGGHMISCTMRNINSGRNQLLSGRPVDFEQCGKHLRRVSAMWAGIIPNSITAESSGVLFLMGRNPHCNVFRFDGQDIDGSGKGLGDMKAVVINAPLDSTILINVEGASTGFRNCKFYRDEANTYPYRGKRPSRKHSSLIIWNFFEARKWSSIDTGIRGTVLAPNAHMDGLRGHIEGSIIGYSLAGNIEQYNCIFTGSIPAGKDAEMGMKCAVEKALENFLKSSRLVGDAVKMLADAEKKGESFARSNAESGEDEDMDFGLEAVHKYICRLKIQQDFIKDAVISLY